MFKILTVLNKLQMKKKHRVAIEIKETILEIQERERKH